MRTLSASFVLYRETKGAIVYQEVDEHGTALKGDNALAATIYLRKAMFPSGNHPKSFNLELKVTG